MATKPPPPKGGAGEAKLAPEGGKGTANRSTSGVPGSKPSAPSKTATPAGGTRPASSAKLKAAASTPAQPKTRLTPWPPSGSSKKRKKKLKIPKWTVPLVLIGCAAAVVWVKFGPKPLEPVVLVLGGGIEEVDGHLSLTAATIDRVGSAGQVLEQIPVSGGKMLLDGAKLHSLLARAPGPVLLRTHRAGTGGMSRTLVTILEPKTEIDEALLGSNIATPSALTLTEARSLRFSSADRGGFELVPAGAGPVFLDATCPPPELVPPGEWFLLYRDGAPAAKAISDASASACVDACKASEEECYDCKIEQANVRTASRVSSAQENNRRHERTQALSQAFAIRADATRFRLSNVDERCYGLIPRHDAELIGAFIVPLEPRHLVLETPEGERPLR